MKAIEGKLNLTHEYEVITIYYSELRGEYNHSCDNCGRAIKNIAVIKDLYEYDTDQEKIYKIGLECLETFKVCGPTLKFQILEKLKVFKKFKRVYYYLRSKCNTVIIYKKDNKKYCLLSELFFTKEDLDARFNINNSDSLLKSKSIKKVIRKRPLVFEGLLVEAIQFFSKKLNIITLD